MNNQKRIQPNSPDQPATPVASAADPRKPRLVRQIIFDPKHPVEIPGGSMDYQAVTNLRWNQGCHTVHYLPDLEVYEVVFHRPERQKQALRIPRQWCAEIPWDGTPLAYESDPICVEGLRPPPEEMPAAPQVEQMAG